MLEADGGHNTAGFGVFDIFLFVGVHAYQTTEPLGLAGPGVEDLGAGFQPAAVQPDERQLTRVGIVHGLKGQAGPDGIADLPLARLTLGCVALDRLGRRRQVGHDGVEQRLHALVAQGRAAQDRKEFHGPGFDRNGPHQLLLAHGFAGQVVFEQFVVRVGNRLDQLIAVAGDLVGQPGRNVFLVKTRSERIFFPHDGLLAHEIDHPAKRVLGAERQLHHERLAPQTVCDLLEHAVKVRPHAVELIDEDDAWHPIFIGLTPDRLRLRLHTADCAEDHHRPVEDAQAAFDLGGKVNVARGVDDVDLMLLPLAADGRCGDGDAALAFLGHPVGDGRSVVDLADLMRQAGVVQHAFADRGFATVNVGNNADIPNVFQCGRHIPLRARCVVRAFRKGKMRRGAG